MYAVFSYTKQTVNFIVIIVAVPGGGVHTEGMPTTAIG